MHSPSASYEYIYETPSQFSSKTDFDEAHLIHFQCIMNTSAFDDVSMETSVESPMHWTLCSLLLGDRQQIHPLAMKRL